MEETREFKTEVRAEGGNGRTLRGHAVVFNALSEDLGGFREIIKPQAVDRTLSEALDVRALVDHDTGKVIGRTRNGTLALRKDKTGLRSDIDPPDTTNGRDILELVRRGDVSGMSFGFRVFPESEGGQQWTMVDDQIIREVMDMTISEVSIVAFPAYRTTSIDVRSLIAFVERQSSEVRSIAAARVRAALDRPDVYRDIETRSALRAHIDAWKHGRAFNSSRLEWLQKVHKTRLAR